MKMDVKRVSKLANLALTPKEEVEFDMQLNDIIGYIERLNSIDTSELEPTAQITGLKNRTRNDNFSNDTLSQEGVLSGAKSKHNGLFVVDKLVDTTG